MENFNNIPNSGTYGAAIALINANFQLTKQQLERLEYSREGFCGMYDTQSALQSAYPSPTSGSFAYVGTSFPMAVYKSNGGTWYDSGQTYDGGSIDLTQYASASDLSSLEGVVNSLKSSGYLFGGVASPSLMPDTISGIKKFYIAWTAGSYSRYGGYTLGDGELAVLAYNGSTWTNSKTDIVAKSIVADAYDDEPTEDSDNLLSSGAIFDALGGLKQELEDDISAIDLTFQSGESISDVAIMQELGDSVSSIPSQKVVKDAVFNTIDISDIDTMDAATLSPFRTANTQARYMVTHTVQSVKYKVGILDVLSDSSGHVLTQVLTSHYAIINGQIDTTQHNDNVVNQYYRSVKINGGTLPTDVGVWTSWKLMNDTIINQLQASIASIEQKVDYTETIIYNIISL